MPQAHAIKPLRIFDFGMRTPIPVHEWGIDHCDECDAQLDDLDKLAFLADDDVLCETCLEARGKAVLRRANAFARRHCKVTGELEVFDPAMWDAPTRDEYAAGLREAHTENSVNAFNRHNRTNYDELIKNLARDSFEDQIFYRAIRHAIDQLLGLEEQGGY